MLFFFLVSDPTLLFITLLGIKYISIKKKSLGHCSKLFTSIKFSNQPFEWVLLLSYFISQETEEQTSLGNLHLFTEMVIRYGA